VGPGAANQQGRLGPVFSQLRESLEAERLQLSEEPEAAPPERVLVLEVAGEMDEFVAAVARVDGLEYLAEELGDKLEDTETFAAIDKSKKRKPLSRELFVVASNERAARELESLWKTWQDDKPLKRGWTQWKHVFGRLVKVRPWDDTDRLARTGAADVWREELADLGTEPIPFEVELWYRADARRRASQSDQFKGDVAEHSGRVLAEYVLEDIGYHGLLAELPANVLLQTAETMSATWATGRGIRFFRASGQAGAPVAEVPEVVEYTAPSSDVTRRAPRIAVLDGLPVAGHDLLAGRIVVDDPDGWEETVEVRHRQHGTAMASAILHGDLAAGDPPLDETLYVRPIIRVDPRYDWVPEPEEVIPVQQLPVQLVHEAVVRMLEGDAAQAPDVCLINLSVGDGAQQLGRFVSPWARLLDHLAAKYEVLFIVSAGNHTAPITIPGDVDLGNPDELEAECLTLLARTAAYRRLLAPAESVNALTVGAAHADSAAIPDDGRINPLVTPGLAATFASWGAGHSRSIKPDVLAPGGRQLLDVTPGEPGSDYELWPSRTARPPGIQVAVPRSGSGSATTWTHGTSPATALATRAGGLLLQRLDALRSEWGDAMPGSEFNAVLVKALIAHSSTWGLAERPMRRALAEVNGTATREEVGRALGYGLIRPAWPLIDDDHRITALYAARLGDGTHEYRLPLPPSLAGRTDWRRVTVTLAWFTPVNVAHRGYRRAKLRVDATGSLGIAPDRKQASNNAVVRGTVQHEVLEGADAVPYNDGTDLSFTVSGSPGASSLDEAVPYAFAVTLETKEGVGLPIYAEVSTRLRARTSRLRA
jgi:hypothetical protein